MANLAWGRSSVAEEQESAPRPRESVIPKKGFETESDIPTIPDAEELSDTASRTVSSSKISIDKSAYRELDSELLKQSSCFALDGISLAPLLKFVRPDVDVKENDAEWTIDSLFKELLDYFENEDGKS